MTTETAAPTATKVLRDFIRANSQAPGAIDALDALHSLEETAFDVAGQRAREAAYSKAIVSAQNAIRSAVKDTKVDLIVGGSSKGKYDVAATEQLLVLAREVNERFGLAIEPGKSECVVIANVPFVRTEYGVRHVDGYVRTFSRDFPLKDSNDNSWRKSMTSNLGYTIRDVYALPRLKDEGEGAGGQQSGARSGARKPVAMSTTPAPKKTDIKAFVARAQAATTLDQVEAAQEWVDGQRFANASGEGGMYSEEEVAQVAAAVADRREALGG